MLVRRTLLRESFPIARAARALCALCLLPALTACDRPLFDVARFKPARPAEVVDVAAARQRRAAAATQPAPSAPAPPRPNLARIQAQGPVNVTRILGHEITVEEILEPIHDELDAAAQSGSPRLYQTQVRDKVRQETRRAIEQILLYAEAVKDLETRQLERLDKAAEQRVAERVERDFDGVDHKFESYLHARGLRRQHAVTRAKRELIVNSYVFERFPGRADLSRSTLKRMYHEQRDRFVSPERRRMSLIELPYRAFLGAVVNPGPLDWAKARSDARVILARVREEIASGVDFGLVAKQYSKGPNAGGAGAWDPITRGALRERYQKVVDALFGLAAGDIAPPVETDQSLFLVKCDRIFPETRVPFGEAQQRIRRERQRENRTKALGAHLLELYEKAHIDESELIRFRVAAMQAAPKHKSQRPAAPAASRR